MSAHILLSRRRSVYDIQVGEQPNLPLSEPDWIDGKITVEVGRFETGRGLRNELNRLNILQGHMYNTDDIPMSGKQYTIEVEMSLWRQ